MLKWTFLQWDSYQKHQMRIMQLQELFSLISCVLQNVMDRD